MVMGKEQCLGFQKITYTYLLTYLITHPLTPQYRTLFEKLIVTQLIKKYPFFTEPEDSSPCSQKTYTIGNYGHKTKFP
jgi:hypothetical protein